MTKFIISTDSSADLYADFLKENRISCIIMKRVQNGREIGEVNNCAADFDSFYEELKKGGLPSTTQLNSYELEEYFEDILEKEKEGDILHIALSSGLSGTCENARVTANEINKKLTDRRIYVMDSLIATGGIAMLVDKAIELRDGGASIRDAIKRIEQMRDHQQGWVIVTNLFHLKRGGRISGFKAAIGTILGVRPIVTVNKTGRLAIENTMKGNKKAIQYVLDKIEDFGVKARADFFDSALYIMRTSRSEMYEEFVQAVNSKYPQIRIKEMIVGPIVGTHLGDGCAIAIFEGAKRPDI